MTRNPGGIASRKCIHAGNTLVAHVGAERRHGLLFFSQGNLSSPQLSLEHTRGMAYCMAQRHTFTWLCTRHAHTYTNVISVLPLFIQAICSDLRHGDVDQLGRYL